MWRILPVLFAASSAIAAAAEAQVRTPDPRGVPPWADTTGESGVYPIGDAVDVYRTVFDLFFVDGDESPSIIVLHDTAERRSGGPCPIKCERAWPHKSKMDTATILAFARLSPKRPRIVPFGYRIPIAFTSWEQDNRLRTEVRARMEREGRSNVPETFEFASELARRYPGMWGKLELTKVGFNRAHTEALVQASFSCGGQCYSDEILFLRKIGTEWRVVERIPVDADATRPSAGMRYRGPDGGSPSESVVLAPASTTRLQTESADAAAVYRTVLDSLYNFHGESPRRVVLTDWFPADGVEGFPAHARPIEPETLRKYAFLRTVRPPLDAKLNYRLPVSTLSRDSIPAFERLGQPLEKQVIDSREMYESTPFWLAFRQRYPAAWGTVGFTRAAFNDQRTQALVFTHHSCGQMCHNADTWLLERTDEKWRVVERIPRTTDTGWQLDSLRYLGVDANPRTYRPRRLDGRVVTETGRALPGLTLMVTRGPRLHRITTDSRGKYSVESLPLMGPVELRVACPAPSPRKPMLVAALFSHAGLDSTMNVTVDFRRCLHNRRARALAGEAPPWPDAAKSTYPNPEEAAVYRGVLDALYPQGGSRKGPILVHPITNRFSTLGLLDIDNEMPRLVRLQLVDASMERNIQKLSPDSVWLRPKFSYRRPVIVLQPSAKRFLYEQGEDFREVDPKRNVSLTALAKQAYPGADGILSFSRVAFNDAHTQAVVQVLYGDSPEYGRGEVMILHRSGDAWRAARRRVERGKTSGERVADRCEPADAPTTLPTLEQIRSLVGHADITVNPTSRGLRAYAGTSHYKFTPTNALTRFRWLPPVGDIREPSRMNRRRVATVQFIDSTAKAHKPLGMLEYSGGLATVTFIRDTDEDGSMEQFRILRVSGRDFFGTWQSGGGQFMPFKGYFCGRLR